MTQAGQIPSGINMTLSRLVVVFVFLGALSMNVAVASAAPVNDSILSSTVINANPYTDKIDITDATRDTDVLDPPNSCQPDYITTVWYTFIAPADGMLTADTFGSGFDTALAAYTGTAAGDKSEVACSFDFNGTFRSQITFAVTAGTTYYFMASGYYDAIEDHRHTGNLQFNVVFTGNSNDSCAGAWQITGGTYSLTMDTTAATLAPNDPQVCLGDSPTTGGNATVWFSYAATADGSVTVDTFGSDYDTMLAAYTGTCGSFTASTLPMVCNDDYSPPARQSLITFDVLAGTTYYFMVADFLPGGGQLTLNFSFTGTGVCPNAPVRINDTDYQPDIPTAYGLVAATGDVINIQGGDFPGNLTLARPVAVTLRGGFDCTYSSNLLTTTLTSAMLTISAGTVTLDGLAIQ